MCAQSLSHFQLFVTPWTVAHQAPLSMGFSRQEYWSGLPCPPLGIFPTQGSNPGILHCRQILYQGSPYTKIILLHLVQALMCFSLFVLILRLIMFTHCLENSAVATGLEKISFHSNLKERQCQRMFKVLHNYTHLTRQQSNAQNSSSQASAIREL